ncbi:MAG: cell surface protein SprA [Gemmatimonadetes bacterium]|nr:MAG: cell surface protein SprA [Gemmatimonadota bacterium]
MSFDLKRNASMVSFRFSPLCLLMFSLILFTPSSSGAETPPEAYDWLRERAFFRYRDATPQLTEQTPGLNFLYGQPLLKSTNRNTTPQRRFEIDYQRGIVVIYDEIYGHILGQPLILSLDEYFRLANRNQSFQNLLNQSMTELARPDRFVDSGGGLVPTLTLPIQIPEDSFFSGWLISEEGEGNLASLTVSGHQRISFSGRTDYYPNRNDNTSVKQSKFPKLDMEQELKVNLEGKIGDKISVLVDHDSRRDSQHKNTIRLRYDGDDDEIIQELEAGNTTLSLGSGPTFIQSSVAHEGLFGIKSRLKFGNLTITTITSKEESNTESSRFEGTAQSDSTILEDYRYIRRQFFYINEPEQLVRDYASGQWSTSSVLPRDVTEIQVWLDDGEIENNLEDGAIYAKADIYGRENATSPYQIIDQTEGNFHRLYSPEDYQIEYIEDASTSEVIGYTLYFRQAISTQAMLGIYYEARDGTTYGRLPASEADTLHLKLIKSITSHLPDDPTWKYEVRNRYRISNTAIEDNNFELVIYRVAQTGDPVEFQEGSNRSYMEIMNLRDPDTGWFIPPNPSFWETGILQVPGIYPFAGGEDPVPPATPDVAFFGPSELTEEERNPDIYNTSDSEINRDTGKYNKFFFVARYARTQKELRLGRLNVLESSIRVYKNGQLLELNKDYRVVPEIGLVTLLEAPLPTDDIAVDYEYSPFLAQSQKTLLGIRGEYEISDRSKIGLTWMYKSESTREDRPRIGNEPSRHMLLDMDVTSDFDMPIFTQLVNTIPFMETEAKSQFRLGGEVAMSLPNPNTKGDAYIDDFEGSEQAQTLGMTDRAWKLGSTPPAISENYTPTPENKAEMFWYNLVSRDRVVQREDIYSNLGRQEADDYIDDILYFAIKPDVPDSSWASVQSLLSKSGISYANSKYIQFWVKSTEGHIHIDMGDVSEDSYNTGYGYVYAQAGNAQNPSCAPNKGNLNSEDIYLGKRDGQPQLNDEDIGLDGIPRNSTRCDSLVDTTDDDADRFNYDASFDYNNPVKYKYVNGTEKNGYLDTEDLDENNRLNTTERFFRYSVDLDSLSEDSRFVVARGNRDPSWRLFQIPLHDPDVIETNTTVDLQDPDAIRSFLDGLKYMRIWFDGVRDTTKYTIIPIYDLQVTGNKWQENNLRQFGTDRDITDAEKAPTEKVEITVRNTQDHEYYEHPRGVYVGKDEEGNPYREQSISLVIQDVQAGHYGSVYLGYPEGQDYLNYGAVAFYLTGYPTARTLPGTEVIFFIRMGADNPDTTHYYEYRRKIDISQGINWEEIKINFADFTQLKLERPETDQYYWTGNLEEGIYAVKGEPSLINVRRITYGVVAIQNNTNGEVWIDDMRVVDVNREPGYAARMSVSTQFADVLSLSANVSWRDAEFYTFRESSGGRQTTFAWGLSGVTLNLHRLFPQSWGLKLPVTGSWTESASTPKYLPSSDILLTRDVADAEKSTSRRQELRAQFSRTTKKGNWLTSLTIDRLTLNGSVSRDVRLTPTREDTTTQVTATGSYSWRLPSNFGLNLKITKFNPLPTDLSLQGTLQRRESKQYTINRTTNSRYENKTQPVKTLGGSMALGFQIFTGLTSSLNVTTNRDLSEDVGERFLTFNLGKETRHSQKWTNNFRPNLPWIFASIRPQFSFETTYDEDNRFISGATNPDGSREYTRNVSVGRRYGASGSLAFNDILRTLGLNLTKTGARVPSPQAKIPKPAAVNDTLTSDEAKTTVPDDGPSIISRGINSCLGGITGIFGRISPITVRYDHNEGQRYDQVDHRKPGYRFQWGLLDSLDVEGRLQAETRSDNYTAGTGVQLLTNLNVNTDYTLQVSENVSTTSSTKNQRESWPKVRVQFNQIEKFPFVRAVLTTASLSSEYSQDSEWSETNGERTSETARTTWKVVSLRSTLFKKINLNYNHDRTNAESNNFGIDGQVNSTTINRTQAHNFTLSSRFRSPQGFRIPLPILSRKLIKFDSDLDLAIPFQYTKTEASTRTKDGTETPNPTSTTTRWSISPSMNYNFSRSITGGMRMKWQEDVYPLDDTRDHRVIEVGINAMFKF